MIFADAHKEQGRAMKEYPSIPAATELLAQFDDQQFPFQESAGRLYRFIFCTNDHNSEQAIKEWSRLSVSWPCLRCGMRFPHVLFRPVQPQGAHPPRGASAAPYAKASS